MLDARVWNLLMQLGLLALDCASGRAAVDRSLLRFRRLLLELERASRQSASQQAVDDSRRERVG